MNASRVAKISQNNTLEDECEQHGAVQQLHAPHGGQQSHLEAGGVGGALGGGAAGTRGRGTLVTLGTGSRSGWRHYDLACSPLVTLTGQWSLLCSRCTVWQGR